MTGPMRMADLVAHPVLAGSTVVAGRAGLERELDDVRWFTGTLTGLARTVVVCGPEHATPPYRLDALVRRAEDAGAAGLLVVADPERPLLSTLRLADRLEIPVVLTPPIDPVLLMPELIAVVRAPEQVRAHVVERLLQLLSTKRSGAEIINAADSVLSASLSLVLPDGRLVLGPAVETADDLHLDRPVAQRGDHALAHPVLDPQAGRVAAWLVCPFERAADTRLDVLANGLAMTEPFIRSWLAAQRARADQDAVHQTQLLSEIIAARDSISRDVVEAAVSLDWRLQDWHVGIHVATPGGDSAPTGRTAELLRAELERRSVAIRTCVNRGDGWALWTSSEAEPGSTEGRSLLRAVRLAAAALPHDAHLAAGIGRPHRGPGGLADTLREARDAADLALSHDFRPAVEHSDELGVARLLATWQRSEVTRAFAESALAPLADTPVLLTTLRAYLESGCSVVETAGALGVHRNTVTARVQQLRERLGIDLDDPSRRLALQVACRTLGV